MSSERDSVTLLHLSDTQFGRNHRFGNLGVTPQDGAFDTLFKRLEIDLAGLKKEHDVVPEAVVVTGDLAEWGRTSEVQDVLEFLARLSDPLGVPRSHVAIVPGNHDINRANCTAYFAECEGNETKPMPPYWPKWKHYAWMFEEFYRGVDGVSFREGEPWTLWEMPELRLVVAGLNSTMVESHVDGTHYGWAGEAQLRWFHERMDRYERAAWTRLGLIHHNVLRKAVDDDENLHDAEKLEQILAPSLDLLLHGHTHNGKMGRLDKLPVLSTGSTALQSGQRPAEVPNQYQCLRLSADGIERWTRGYDPQRGDWIGDNRSSRRGGEWFTKEKVAFPAFGNSSAPAPPKPLHDPRRYIQALLEETSYIDVQGLKFGDNRAYQFAIEEFYIPLTTSAGSAQTGDKPEASREREVPLVDALRSHRKLLVVGDPGSGKSTFLKRVTHQMCREYGDAAPLPVAMGAAALAGHIALHHGKDGPAERWSPDWIPLYAAAHCAERNRGLDAEYFRERLKSGGCHVLIDGLDETPDEASRVNMAHLIRDAAAAFDGCRFVVTSRPEGKVAIRGFEEALIGEVQPAEMLAYLEKLARHLYASDPVKETRFRQDLAAAVNGRREIRKMTRNPVMLTALAVLQHNEVKLPENRVDLYGSILEWLSKQRARKDRLPATECLLRLRELALAMQDHEDGRQKQAPVAWAGETLARHFGNRERAERFLRAEQADSGIVVSRGTDIAYWHLTFQEYLAALEIAGWEDGDQHALILGGEPAARAALLNAPKNSRLIQPPASRQTAGVIVAAQLAKTPAEADYIGACQPGVRGEQAESEEREPVAAAVDTALTGVQRKAQPVKEFAIRSCMSLSCGLLSANRRR
ncbi:MAG: metallophosphoesterase [Bryobacteraceae bacterium]